MFGLWVLMRRRLDGIEGRFIWNGFVKSLLAALVMGLAIWAWLAITDSQPAWIVAIGGIIVGGIVFGTMGVVLRVPEVTAFSRFLRRKISRTI